MAMLQSLNDRCLAPAGSAFTLQAVITKADAITPEQVEHVIPKMRGQIFEVAPTRLPPIITSALMRPQFGIEETRRSIMEACGFGTIEEGVGGSRA
jgi:GTP-binding protein